MVIRVTTNGETRTVDPDTVEPEVTPRDQVAEAADRVEEFLEAYPSTAGPGLSVAVGKGGRAIKLRVGDVRALLDAARA